MGLSIRDLARTNCEFKPNESRWSAIAVRRGKSSPGGRARGNL